jgi:hypothetical protein
MTNPQDPLVRLANLEAAFAKAGPRLDAIESALGNGGARITALEGQLQQAIDGVTPTVTRVEELSGAAVAFNERLNSAEQKLAEWLAQNPAGDERITALQEAVTALATRLTTVEQTRARGGRLSNRLANIESKLDQILNPPAEGEESQNAKS